MGYLQMLIEDPMWTIEFMFYQIPALLMALTLHEWAHAYVAYRCGDNTAQMMGRLTLNPLKHLDPIGTIMLLTLGFGYAKPVPVNPRNYRNYRRDDVLVSLAGITVNLILFLCSMLLCTALQMLILEPEIFGSLSLSEWLSFDSGWIQVVMYGYAGEYSGWYRMGTLIPFLRFFALFARINLYLALFNLLPIPPLDGFHVFNDIILRGKLRLSGRAFQISMVAVLLLSYTGILGKYLSIAAGFIQDNLLRLLDLIF